MPDDAVLPTPEEQQRAKWDLLLTDLEYRGEQLRHAKSYNPVEMETRLEQLRHAKSYNPVEIETRLQQLRYEPRRFWISAITAAAALMGAGGVVGGLIVRLLYAPAGTP
jgi:hypothetical protein